MSDIQFDCPECGHDLIVDGAAAGRSVPCPECKATITIPGSPAPGAAGFKEEAPPVVASAVLRKAQVGGMMRCPSCGEDIVSDAFICRHCGWTRHGNSEKLAWHRYYGLSILKYAVLGLVIAGAAVYVHRGCSRSLSVADKAIDSAREKTALRVIELSGEGLIAEPAPPVEPVREAEPAEPDKIQTAPRMTVEAAEQAVRARFRIATDQPLFTSLHLKDGAILEAKTMTEESGQYVCSVFNKSRTILTPRTIPKADVTRVEEGTKDRAVWEVIREAQLANNSVDPAYYDKVIEICFDAFLNEYPGSKYCGEVRTLRQEWDRECEKVNQGHTKLGGRWYAPGETLPKRLPHRTRQMVAALRGWLGTRGFEKALESAARIRIPDGFEEEKKVFVSLAASALAGCSEEIEAAQEALNRRRDEIRCTFATKRSDIESRLFVRPLKRGATSQAKFDRRCDYMYTVSEQNKRIKVKAATRKRDEALAAVEKEEIILHQKVDRLSIVAKTLVHTFDDARIRMRLASAAPALVGRVRTR